MNEIFRGDLGRPSTTITVAALAGGAVTLASEIAMQVGMELRPTLVGAAVTFFSSLAGYLVRERVLPVQRPTDEHENGGP